MYIETREIHVNYFEKLREKIPPLQFWNNSGNEPQQDNKPNYVSRTWQSISRITAEEAKFLARLSHRGHWMGKLDCTTSANPLEG